MNSTQNSKSAETEKPCFHVRDESTTRISYAKQRLSGGYRCIWYDCSQGGWDSGKKNVRTNKMLLPRLLSSAHVHFHKSASSTWRELWPRIAPQPLCFNIRGWLRLSSGFVSEIPLGIFDWPAQVRCSPRALSATAWVQGWVT